MSEPRITRIDDAEWGESSELGEILAEAFAAEDDDDGEPWYSAYFPFFWSCGPEGSDGMGGPPVSSPLEFRVYLEDMSTRAAVTRHYALDEIMREEIADQLGPDGKYADADSREWAERTATALEALAREIREAL